MKLLFWRGGHISEDPHRALHPTLRRLRLQLWTGDRQCRIAEIDSSGSRSAIESGHENAHDLTQAP